MLSRLTMTDTVQLPWPQPQLWPNYTRMHPARKAKYKRAYKTACWALAMKAKLCAPGTELIGLELTFHPPDRRKRDDDGMEGAFKHGRDGLALALKIDDTRFRSSKIIGPVVSGGMVVARLFPLTNGP